MVTELQNILTFEQWPAAAYEQLELIGHDPEKTENYHFLIMLLVKTNCDTDALMILEYVENRFFYLSWSKPLRAKLMERQGNIDQAIILLKESIEDIPNTLNNYLELCSLLEKKGAYNEAIEICKVALLLTVNTSSERGLIYTILGNLYQEIGNWIEAIVVYQTAIELSPRQATFHYHLGIVLARVQDLRGALEAYSEAIRLKPDYVEACNNLAIVLIQMEEYDRALHAINQVLSLQPGRSISLINKAEILSLLGQHREAVTVLRTVIDDNLTFHIQYNMGRSLMKCNDFPAAIACFRYCEALSPENSDVRRSFVLCLVRGRNVFPVIYHIFRWLLTDRSLSMRRLTWRSLITSLQ